MCYLSEYIEEGRDDISRRDLFPRVIMKSKLKKEVKKRLIPVKEAAVMLGRSYSGMMDLIHAGKLPYVRFDKPIYVDINDLEKFIEQNKGRYTF
jgi:hypothetical protein